MASTRGLQPDFKPYADFLVDVLRQVGPYRVTSGLRTYGEQVVLYQRWLEGDPGVLTPAPPGRSQHERGWAVDLAQPGVSPQDDEALAELGAWWRSVGGVWGGSADPVHFEAPKTWTGRG